jgi:formyltetrahydrofolate-dependent phosphoribosylglycinamide formyltransferase
MTNVFTPEVPMRLAVLLSGSGRTLQNLIAAHASGMLGPTRIAFAVATRAGATGIAFAADAEIPAKTIARADFATDAAWSEEVTTAFTGRRIDAVALAGCIHRYLIPPQYKSAVLNIHPSLIPAFAGPGWYGGKSHEGAFDRGVKLSGCTVHFATNEYDAGPIVLQRAVDVGDCDSADAIGERVFAAECEAFPAAIRLLAEGRLAIDGSRVRVSND